jgi:tetratricopeptide (TPR) repeat protein
MAFSAVCLGQDTIGGKVLSNPPVLPDTSAVDSVIFLGSQDILLWRKDTAIYYASIALDYARKLDYLHGIAQAFSLKSQIAKHFDDDNISSEKFGREALSYFEKTQNKSGIDTVYNYLFSATFAEAKFEEASEYSEKLYAEAIKKNNQDEIFASLSAMFALNRQIGNYEKSFHYAQQLYEIAVKAGNKLWLSGSLWNLAQVYASVEDYPTALDYYRRVREISDSELLENRIYEGKEIWFDMEFAELFGRTNQFDSAWYYYQAYKPSNQAFNPVYFTSIGEYYFEKGNFQQALQNYQLGLTEHQRHNDVNEVMRSLLDIAKVWLVLDRPLAALNYGRQALDISLQTKANQNIRDAYKILSDAYSRLDREDSSNYYFRKYTVVKDVVLNDLIKGKFAAYNYEQRIEIIDKDKHIQEIRLQKETLLKNILVGGIILLFSIAVVIFRNIILKRRNEARRRELIETELEMKAIRAQMSPHFIFNCLNSINRFIICNDAEKAADYLTKFARLIRMVLEKSGNALISLEDELKCLRLYMDLEAIRFEDPFVYEIYCHGMDMDLVMIPSLLIQPFVENAIWHGLHPNEGIPGKIRINLRLENNYLHCEIADNGIGLEKSAALKANGLMDKKSLGIELTLQRLHLADPIHPAERNVSFQPLSDNLGENAGTCVHVIVPVKYK